MSKSFFSRNSLIEGQFPPQAVESKKSGQQQGGTRLGLFDKVRLISRKGEKFKFELRVQGCSIRLPTSKRITIEWIRGT